ncbi:MAG: hypothetical protein JOZ62_10485 [Acidobacteriaceae bacterium]|nr:hypothetical protein [Acidobacteriaceae bacterium]
MLCGNRVEYAHQKKIRVRNKALYRLAHWPIWIWVFFLAPGPLTFNLFAHGVGIANVLWLAIVVLGTGIAATHGALPGVEPRPYILRFCEDRPNPLYRRLCYTFAWNALLNFALLNLAGLLIAAVTRRWYLRQIYWYGYFPVLFTIVLLGALKLLPRAGTSTREEGQERRYFYSALWAITAAQIALLILWKALPRTHSADLTQLAAYVSTLAAVELGATFGLLPRTRPILPGELIVAD